jgi:hypothetical protein
VPNQPSLAVRTGEILGTFAVDPTDGTLYASWQDARFTNGGHDAIALSRSTDGGLTWSAPVRVNANPAVPAFTPTLAVLPTGAVGVLYYDLRQAGTATYQPAEVWLATSTDATAWTEARLAGAFDLLDAPNAGGLFLGDYNGLVGSGSTFLALYSRVTGAGDLQNRTDVFADRVEAGSVAVAASQAVVRKASTDVISSDMRNRVSAHLTAVRANRSAQWQAWRQPATP